MALSDPSAMADISEDVLLRVARAISAPTGDHFLENLARSSAEILGTSYILIALREPAGERLRSYLLLADQQFREQTCIEVTDSPHQTVLGGDSRVIQQDVRQQFPSDALLREANADCYAGAPLLDQDEEVIGLFAAFGPGAFSNPALIRSVLSILASRTATEICRHRLEQQLLHATRIESIGKLAGGIAHDFNNLLTVILSGADYAVEMLGPEHPLVDDLNDVRDAGRRGAELTRQLLAFSRQQYMEAQPVDLNQLAQGVSRILQRLLGETIEIRMELSTDLPLIMADPGHIQQVIINMAVNARDAMPDGGTLTIRTRQTEDKSRSPMVELGIVDTGSGIPGTDLDRVFEPFFTTAKPGQGSGLGLAAVHGIVSQSGGSIQVESNPGQGSHFRILLPVASQKKTQTAEPNAPAATTASEHILIVEDEEQVARMTEQVLASAGYRITRAVSADAAIALLNKTNRSPALVITDRVMPGMSGLELSRWLAEHHPQTRVILTSGYSDFNDDETPEASVRFLAKPYNLSRLRSLVRELLDEAGAING